MKRIIYILMIATLVAGGCKNSKKTTASAESSTTRDSNDGKSATADVKQELDAGSSEKELPEDRAEEEKDINAEKSARQQISDLEPEMSENTYFIMVRTPCFGRCPVYNLEIFLNGLANLEGKKFFDYEGTFQTKLSEDQMDQITNWAKEYGYFDFDHVYDAPVTDLPSTTTALRTEDGIHWVYNRMNSPESLRQFEQEIETLIKDLQWKPVESE